MDRRIGTSRDWHARIRPATRIGAVLLGVAVLGVGPWAGALRGAAAAAPSREERAQGRELFEREWLPGDSQTHGGDGLGPVYNDSSCIACHNLGGGGGGGAASKNVDIITASANTLVQQDGGASTRGEPGFLAKSLGSLVGLDVPDDSQSKSAKRTSAARPP